MHGTSFLWNRVQEISEISRWLKELARVRGSNYSTFSIISAVEQRI